MNLWALSPKPDMIRQIWTPWYDKVFKMVVRAEDEESARKMAADSSGFEGGEAWIDSKYSSCLILNKEGEEEVIVIDCAES